MIRICEPIYTDNLKRRGCRGEAPFRPYGDGNLKMCDRILKDALTNFDLH
jgi:hypothetical protein